MILKLVSNQIKKFIVTVIVSIAVSVAVTLIFSLLLKEYFSFMSLWCYAVGAFVSIWTCIFFRKKIKYRGYCTQDDLGGTDYWANCISDGKILNRFSVYMTLLPYLVIGIAIFAIVGIFYNDIQSIGQAHYIGLVFACTALSALGTTMIVYFIISICSLKVCKECGSVNAYICEEDSEHVSTTAFYRYNVGGLLSHQSMPIFKRKVEANGDRLLCHCAKCGNKKLITEIYDSDWHWL